MKTCSWCKRDKPEEGFNWRYKGKQRQSHCRECQNDYGKKHYKKNIEKYKAKSKINKKTSRKKALAAVGEFLSEHPCADCGNTDIRVLEFHHTSEKENTISRLMHDGYKPETILAEIDKCDVLCANCHRIRHSIERRDWRTLYKRG
jgi:hypothetical protein